MTASIREDWANDLFPASTRRCLPLCRPPVHVLPYVIPPGVSATNAFAELERAWLTPHRLVHGEPVEVAPEPRDEPGARRYLVPIWPLPAPTLPCEETP